MSQDILIRFRLEKQDIEASLKLVRQRKLLPPWLIYYAVGIFLAFAAYKTAPVQGYLVATIPLIVSLLSFAIPSMFPRAPSKNTLEILEKSPEANWSLRQLVSRNQVIRKVLFLGFLYDSKRTLTFSIC